MAIMQIEQVDRDSAGKIRHAWLRTTALQLLLLAILAAPCLAQTEPEDTVRVDSDLVNLHVSVLGHDLTKPPEALQQKDFAVLDDGELQEVRFFAAADAPFDLLLLLDLSGSTADKLKLIRR